MIRLHPIPEAWHECPYCKVLLEVKDWYIPGMRNLADLQCSNCERQYYGDLLSGHGLYHPMLLEKQTGVVHDLYGADWFAGWLRRSYAQRCNSPVGFTIEEFRAAKKAILLNCVDTLYGHCLLKLLNVQYYLDHRPELDLIVMVQPFLRWMVPDGVAAIWTVDLPLSKGIEWNDWLAVEIKKRIGLYGESRISVAFSHPHPEDFSIERYTRVNPFAHDEWEKRLTKPCISFIWREDRCWDHGTGWGGIRLPLLGRFVHWAKSAEMQRRNVLRLAEILREDFPQLDFAIVGLGCSTVFPSWIKDMRAVGVTSDLEGEWCQRYARSHVVIGVHGSNMLLPSAHAGASLELIPADRWGNMLQDLLFRPQDCREALFHNRVMPISTSPECLAQSVHSLLIHHLYHLITMRREFCDHDSTADVALWSTLMRAKTISSDEYFS
jgi:hypothetical protein